MPLPHTKESHVPKRQGFTLIEVIIAMSVILILIGMLVVGLKYLSASSKTKATEVALQNATALVAELEATAGLSRLPFRGAIDAPGDVSEGSPDQYSDGLRITRETIRALRAVPANRQSMDQLPTSTVGIPAHNPATSYEAGDQVTGPDGKIYVATSPMGTGSPVPPSGSWDLTNDPVPFILDGWGNPILFVPPPNLTAGNEEERYGLRDLVVADRGSTKYRMMNPGGIEDQSITPSDSTIYPPSSAPDRLRHFRSFWVSAGPDGNFRTHDDNIYSFDN